MSTGGDLLIQAKEGDVKLQGVDVESADGQTWTKAERDVQIPATATGWSNRTA